MSKSREENHETTGGLDADIASIVHERAFGSTTPEKVHLSQLQEKILGIVCTRQKVDYVTLMKETNRDRVTQSVNSLADRHYVSKDKIDPEYEKSKVIIKATFLGKDYSVNFLKVNLEDILKVEDDEHISAFLEFIKDIPDSQRHELIDPLKDLFRWLHEGWVFDYRIKRKDELINEILIGGLKMGIPQLIRNENYDAKKLLNQRSIKYLKLFSNIEIQNLRQYIIEMKDNLISTTQMFPE